MLSRAFARRRLRMNACAFTKQACGKYARIVQHHELIATEQGRQFPERAIFPRAALAIEHQHPGGFATRCGMLGNLINWQFVIKSIYSHQFEL